MITQLIKQQSEDPDVNILVVSSRRTLAAEVEKQAVLNKKQRLVTSTTGENLEDLIGDGPEVVVIDESRMESYQRIIEHIENRLTPTKVVVVSEKNMKQLEKSYGIFSLNTTHVSIKRGSKRDYYGFAKNIASFSKDALNKFYATTDPLTGLMARRVITEKLNDAWNNISSLEENQNKRTIEVVSPKIETLSLVYLDMDLFKDVNEKISHQKGDEVISCLAEAIESVFQRKGKGDYCSRIGGEEYLLVIKNTPGYSIKKKMIEVQKEFSKRCVFTLEEQEKLGRKEQTFSTGIVTYKSAKVPYKRKLVQQVFDPALLIQIAEYGCKIAKGLVKESDKRIVLHDVNTILEEEEKLTGEEGKARLRSLFMYSR